MTYHQTRVGTLAFVAVVALSGCLTQTKPPAVSPSTTKSASSSIGLGLPAGFPTEVTEPNFGTIIGSYAGSLGSSKTFSVTYFIPAADAEGASTRYQEQLKITGFSIKTTVSTNEGGRQSDVFTAEKGRTHVGVSVNHNADDTASMSLAVTQKAQ